MTWTAPYHGVSHYGDTKGRWATVTEWLNFTELTLHYPTGSGQRSYGYTYLARYHDDHLALAKTNGEAWVHSGTIPHPHP